MTENAAAETLFGEPPATQTERLRTQLAAVALLVARTDRDTAQEDILLATVFEVLTAGSLTANQIKLKVEEAWPRLQLIDTQFRAALHTAEQIQHVGVVTKPDSTVVHYELLEAGRRCLDESLEQAADSIDRFHAQITDEMRERRAFRDASDASNVASVVIAGLRLAIAEALRPDSTGEVTNRGGALHLVGSTLDLLDSFVEQRVPDSDRADLIKGLTAMALDHSRGLGNELVHRLIVGHLLYVFMGRPDRLRAAAAVGAPCGEIVVVDTPVLVALLGPPDTANPIRDLLALSRQVGVRVVLFERTVRELEHLLDAVGNHEAATVERQLRDGVDARVLVGLQRNNRVLWGWLHWCARRDDNWSWETWRSSSAGDAAMLSLLRSIGVEVSPDETFDGDFDLSARCVAFEEKLRLRVEADGVRLRSDEVLHHDALNLTAVYRARRDKASRGGTTWPGAFLLTTDGQVNDTYADVAGRAAFPAAVTFSQLAELVAACSTPRQSEELAFAVAGEVAEEILLSRAALVPVELAGELAKALRTEPVTDAEVEQLVLDINRSMSTGRDRLLIGTPDNADVVNEATRRLRERRERRQAEERAAQVEEQRRRELAAARQAASLDATAKENLALQAEVQSARDELAQRDRDAEVRRREVRAERIVMIAAAVSLVLLVLGHWGPGVLGLVACGVAWVERGRWAREATGLTTYGLMVAYGIATLWPLFNWLR